MYDQIVVNINRTIRNLEFSSYMWAVYITIIFSSSYNHHPLLTYLLSFVILFIFLYSSPSFGSFSFNHHPFLHSASFTHYTFPFMFFELSNTLHSSFSYHPLHIHLPSVIIFFTFVFLQSS